MVRIHLSFGVLRQARGWLSEEQVFLLYANAKKNIYGFHGFCAQIELLHEECAPSFLDQVEARKMVRSVR